MAETALTITRFPNQYASRKTEWEPSWADFVEWLDNLPRVSSKDGTQWVKLAKFGDKPTPTWTDAEGKRRGGSLRNNENIISICGVEGDYDKGEVSPEDALGRLEFANLRAVIVTTYSHTPERPRWRVFAPLSQEHTREERERLVAGLNGALGGILAGESFTQSQGFYVGGPEGGEYRVIHTFGDVEEGYYLDEWDDLDIHAIYKSSHEGTNNPEGASSEWLENILHGKELNPSCTREVGRLVAMGLSRDEIRVFMEGALSYAEAHRDPERIRQYLDGGEFDRQYQGALKKGYGPATVDDFDFIPQEAHSGPESDAAEKQGQPLGVAPFDLEAARVDSMLDNPAPKREWLVPDFLPLGVVGLLAAAGGTGKSFATLQLAVSTATGWPFFGMAMERTGSVLIVSAEDDRDEIHRRLHAVVDHYSAIEDLAGDWSQYDQAIRDRLRVVDRVGMDNRLTMSIKRETIRTGFAKCVIETAKLMDGPALIVLDPLSRFDGGEPNDNSDGTRLIEAAESIRIATGATVLLPHHVSKASLRDDSSGQDAIRGASGLVDGARWAALMQSLPEKEAKGLGISEDEAGHYLRMRLVKANYVKPTKPLMLRRQDGGALEAVNMPTSKRNEREVEQDSKHRQIVDKVIELITVHGPMSARHIRTTYAGVTGLLGAGDRSIRGSIARALEDGDLVTLPGTGQKGGGGELLNTHWSDEDDVFSP